MGFSTQKLTFFAGKKRRNFEIDYFVLRTSIFSIFLTRSTVVFKEGLDRLRMVFWLGRHNQIARQVFLP